jgi:hypothetical protein
MDNVCFAGIQPYYLHFLVFPEFPVRNREGAIAGKDGRVSLDGSGGVREKTV